MNPKSVFCLATSRTQAGQIVDRLKAARFSNNDISAQAADHPTRRSFAPLKRARAPEGAVAGVGIGGTLGWMAGIGVLAIPGFGPFIDTSPVLAVVCGVVMGATVCGIAGGLIGMGFPKYKARSHEDRHLDGNVLISVHTESAAEITHAEVIFAHAGAKDICTAGETAVTDDNRETEIINYPAVSALKSRAL